MHGYKFIALALAKSIYYSHRDADVKMCIATLFEICLMGATVEIDYALDNSFKNDIK